MSTYEIRVDNALYDKKTLLKDAEDTYHSLKDEFIKRKNLYRKHIQLVECKIIEDMYIEESERSI